LLFWSGVLRFYGAFPKKPRVIVARGIDALSRPRSARKRQKRRGFFGTAEGAVFAGLDSAMPRADPAGAAFWGKMRAAVEHLFARA
jgi:hypothetical protein